RAFSRYGTRIPAWCTAAGRVILAYSSRKMIDLIPEDLTAYTLNTITNRDALIAELDTVRTEGFSVNRGELDESVWSMGVPVWSTAAVPIAAVSFSAPADRFQKRDIVADAEWLRELARSLSRRLGSTPA
ncbi:MAG: IclR family transcriptional regulator C-terminal domain-containing protein, partial [Pseudomonadota bacterium]